MAEITTPAPADPAPADPAPAPAPADPDPAPEDPCMWCGADNGPCDPATGRGIARMGWDCYNCGGN